MNNGVTGTIDITEDNDVTGTISVTFHPHVTAKSVSPPQPSHEEVVRSDCATIGSSQDRLEMLRSGIPVEPLGIEHMDWVQEPEDEIFLGRMVSTNDFYYKNDDATAPIEQSPNDVTMGRLRIT